MTPERVHVHIDRLQLSGFDLAPEDERVVRGAVEGELARLLEHGPLPGGDRRLPRPPGPPLHVGAWSDHQDLGRRIARSVHQGMGR